MNSYAAHIKHLAVARHFAEGSYDYFKYQGKVPLKKETAAAHKGKFFYEKLARKFTTHERILSLYVSAYFAIGKTRFGWVGNIASEEVFAQWKADQKRLESLTYTIENDLRTIDRYMEEHEVTRMRTLLRISNPDEESHPQLLSLYIAGDISKETLLAINHTQPLFPFWNMKITEQVVWPDIRDTLLQYDKFLSFDKSAIVDLLMPRF